MRIATGYQYDQAMRQIHLAQQRYVESQRQAATGKRFERLHEDPTAGALLMNLTAYKGSIQQFQKNLAGAKASLGFTDSALSDSKDLVQKAYTLAVRAANATTSQEARNQMATEIGEMQRQLVGLANARGPSGEYLFAGHETGEQPFSLSGTGLTYNGDAGEIRAEIGPGETMAVIVQGDALFRQTYDALEALRTHMLGGDVAMLSGVDVEALQQRMNALTQQRGAVGAKLSHIAERDSQNQRRLDDLASNISDVQDVDMAEAVFMMKSAEVAYQAALQVGAQGFKLSLMDFIS